MANNQTYPTKQILVLSGADVNSLSTAINNATKAIANNVIGVTDISGAPIGSQTVVPNSTDIQYGTSFIDKAGDDTYTAAITYTEFLPL